MKTNRIISFRKRLHDFQKSLHVLKKHHRLCGKVALWMPKQTILKNFELVNLLTLQFNRMGLNRILNVRFLEE